MGRADRGKRDVELREASWGGVARRGAQEQRIKTGRAGNKGQGRRRGGQAGGGKMTAKNLFAGVGMKRQTTPGQPQ